MNDKYVCMHIYICVQCRLYFSCVCICMHEYDAAAFWDSVVADANASGTLTAAAQPSADGGVIVSAQIVTTSSATAANAIATLTSWASDPSAASSALSNSGSIVPVTSVSTPAQSTVMAYAPPPPLPPPPLSLPEPPRQHGSTGGSVHRPRAGLARLGRAAGAAVEQLPSAEDPSTWRLSLTRGCPIGYFELTVGPCPHSATSAIDCIAVGLGT